MAKTSRNKSSKPASRLPAPLVRALVWLVLAGLVTAAGYVGATTAWAALASSPQFQLDLQSFALGDHPSWVKGEEMSRELAGTLTALPDGASVFDRGVVEAVHRQLGSSPWLVQVSGVQRRLPNVLLIQATFRRPAGLAIWDGSRYMVDKDGCPLPERLFNPPLEWLGKPIPSIVDRSLKVPPPLGRAWDKPRMAVGAQFSEYLRRSGLYDRLSLATIDVTNVGRGSAEPDIVLTTTGGAQIKWGASSVYPNVGLSEATFLIPDAEKLQVLLGKLVDYPDLQGIQYLDLRFHGKVYFREVTDPGTTAGGGP